MAKIGIRLEERGLINDAKTPVIENGNGPSSFKQSQPASDLTSGGTWLPGHTIESSSGVRVIEASVAGRRAHSGTSVLGSRRVIAKCSARRRKRRGFTSIFSRIRPVRKHKQPLAVLSTQ